MQLAREASRRDRNRPDLEFYYATQAAMLEEDVRRLGNGAIHYDFYRARARRMRRNALAAHLRAIAHLVVGSVQAAIAWIRRPAALTPASFRPGQVH
jgi:hypothetical protein